MQLPLYPPAVVVSDVIPDGSCEAVLSLELPAIIYFTLEYSPEAFHRTVVCAMCNPGHAMHASMFLHKACGTAGLYTGIHCRCGT